MDMVSYKINQDTYRYYNLIMHRQSIKIKCVAPVLPDYRFTRTPSSATKINSTNQNGATLTYCEQALESEKKEKVDVVDVELR
jgi:hypothetical protein